MTQRNLTDHQKAVEEAAGMSLDWGMANAAAVARAQPIPSEIAVRATFAKMEKWIERFENGACNAMQILNVVRGEWKESNSWSEWDESVCQEMVALQRDIAALAPYLKEESASAKTITIHVEGGMVQDVTGIPPGIEVRVEDYDHSDDTQPTWDAEKGCHVVVYGGEGV